MLVVAILTTLLTLESHASPFLLTEKYVDDFQLGIDAIKKISENHIFEEPIYDASIHNETLALKDAKYFDFIIIGGGTSGSVLANRLSEIPEWKVLVLESGHKETQFTQIPSLSKLLKTTPYNWGYTTTPQSTWCQGMIDQKCGITSGRALGGSSSINNMLYTRGHPKDYDLWSDQGNEGWCFKDVLPYFQKIEDAHLENYDRKYHNHGGPLHIETQDPLSELSKKILKAGEDLGIQSVDYNGKTNVGLGIAQITRLKGKRLSTAQAYLNPAESRKNLYIQPNCQAIKILIGQHAKEATAVEYIQNGNLVVAKAKKEIVLAAGPINTPQLLLLSGIGPGEDLEKLGINQIHNLKVGKNLKDHIVFLGLDFIFDQAQPSNEKQDIIDYLKDGSGPLSKTNLEIVSFLENDYPQIQLLFIPTEYNKGEEFKGERINQDIYNSLYGSHQTKWGMKIAVLLTHPKSSGTLTLKSPNPLHYPEINLNHLSDLDNHDLGTLLAGIRHAIKIGEKLGGVLNHNVVKGCESNEFNSDEYWKCAVRHISVSANDLSGTCQMGVTTNEEAIVDEKLRVHGVGKLRIADSSVIPVSITGGTMAATIMIGEKAADLIKKDWL